jgi:hypothetical protein
MNVAPASFICSKFSTDKSPCHLDISRPTSVLSVKYLSFTHWKSTYDVDGVDCFYDDREETINLFIDKCWIRYISNQHPITPREEK